MKAKNHDNKIKHAQRVLSTTEASGSLTKSVFLFKEKHLRLNRKPRKDCNNNVTKPMKHARKVFVLDLFQTIK